MYFFIYIKLSVILLQHLFIRRKVLVRKTSMGDNMDRWANWGYTTFLECLGHYNQGTKDMVPRSVVPWCPGQLTHGAQVSCPMVPRSVEPWCPGQLSHGALVSCPNGAPVSCPMVPRSVVPWSPIYISCRKRSRIMII